MIKWNEILKKKYINTLLICFSYYNLYLLIIILNINYNVSIETKQRKKREKRTLRKFRKRV